MNTSVTAGQKSIYVYRKTFYYNELISSYSQVGGIVPVIPVEKKA